MDSRTCSQRLGEETSYSFTKSLISSFFVSVSEWCGKTPTYGEFSVSDYKLTALTCKITSVFANDGRDYFFFVLFCFLSMADMCQRVVFRTESWIFASRTASQFVVEIHIFHPTAWDPIDVGHRKWHKGNYSDSSGHEHSYFYCDCRSVFMQLCAEFLNKHFDFFSCSIFICFWKEKEKNKLRVENKRFTHRYSVFSIYGRHIYNRPSHEELTVSCCLDPRLY